MKTILISGIVAILIACTPAFSQVDDIKKKSDKYKKDDNSSSDSNIGSSNDPVFDACFETCASGCFDIALSVVTEIMIQHHIYLMDSRNEDPTALSLDLMMHTAYEPNNQIVNVVPRIRGTWGVLSTDFRFNHLVERDQAIATFKTLSWQILALHFGVPDAFSFRIGSGFYYDISDALMFNEHYTGLQLKFGGQSILLNLEYRIALDYEHSETVFQDFDANIAFRLLNFPNLYTYANVGFVHQKYYPDNEAGIKTDFSMVKAGITFNIH